MPKKEYKVKGTIRQKAVIEKMSENVRNKKFKSKGQILKECDYSDEFSKQPSRIFESKGVKQGLKPIIEEMETERDEAIKEAKNKRNKAKYRDLIDSVDKLTKNIQLLGGKETDIIKSIEVVEIIEPK